MNATKTISTQNGQKRKAEACLLDPNTSVKIILWQEFIDEVQENNTYVFTNLSIRKDTCTNEVYLTTPQTECSIELCDSFDQPLATPSQLTS